MQVSTRHRPRLPARLTGDVLVAPLLAATAVVWLVLAVGAIGGRDAASAGPTAHGTPAELAHQLSGDLEGTPSRADIARARRPLSQRKRLLAAHPYFGLYKIAKRSFGVSWYLVAAVHYQETGFGKAPATLAKNATWQHYRHAERGMARPASYPHEATGHPSVRDAFDVVAAIGAQLKADGAGAVIGPSAEQALEDRYGTSPAGRLSAAMVYERARAWHLLGTLPLPGRGELATPVKGVVGGCGYFGCPRPGHLHNGVDFLAPAGAPIHAADEGRVALVQSVAQSGGYGNFVCIQHRPHLASCYAHMSAVAEGIAVGAVVRRGQVIGLVGSTGSSTAPHLHFEVRRGPADCSTCAVDPLPMLSGEVPGTEIPQMATPAPVAPSAAHAAPAAPAPASTASLTVAPGEQTTSGRAPSSDERTGSTAPRTARSPSYERAAPDHVPALAPAAPAPAQPAAPAPGSAGAGTSAPATPAPPDASAVATDPPPAEPAAPADQAAAAPPPA